MCLWAPRVLSLGWVAAARGLSPIPPAPAATEQLLGPLCLLIPPPSLQEARSDHCPPSLLIPGHSTEPTAHRATCCERSLRFLSSDQPAGPLCIQPT